MEHGWGTMEPNRRVSIGTFTLFALYPRAPYVLPEKNKDLTVSS